MNDAFVANPCPTARPRTGVERAEASPGRHGVAMLRGIVATWSERIRLRCRLEQISRDDPHLIDDIGLTKRQVEAEIAKPFWRA